MKPINGILFGLITSAAFGLLGSLGVCAADITAEERQELERQRRQIENRLAATKAQRDHLADVRVFLKGVEWALLYETKLESKDVALIKTALQRARQRSALLQAGRPIWAARKGRLARGFVSAVDGSVQPYGLIVPASYKPAQPMRLDVVLHGSTRPTGLSELRFLNRFDVGDGSSKDAPAEEYIELHPLGRVENGYRWAGETDVFEAIEAVARNYNIDRERIVLRGMSMGASGTWHLGLKHPDFFVSLGPYCGYVDTFHFSRTPLPNFIKVGPLPAHQGKTLHMLDAIDYAANAGVVPAIACMGEKDVFFQAHVLMAKAMEREGLKMINLISPGTGHVVDPVTHKEQMRRIHEIAAKGLDRKPRHVRFVTWTLKYSRCHWLQIEGLEEHYRRAELDARIAENGTIEVAEPKNVTRFAILPPAWQGTKTRLRVASTTITLPASARTSLKAAIGRHDGKWVFLGDADSLAPSGKRPGVQGPIDDAFTAPFLCVRGTGKAWHPSITLWAEASSRRFASEWKRYFRGELKMKDDTQVTEEDARSHNLVLFGDPGNNSWIRRVLAKLPVEWTPAELTLGKKHYSAAQHVPLLIQPSPFAPARYVVFNSGHTFRESELASLNYLLFPRLGDWAVLRIDTGKSEKNPSQAVTDRLVDTGFFDEQWRLP
jgi:poly(3-hydroxybutyrate) depolymerase